MTDSRPPTDGTNGSGARDGSGHFPGSGAGLGGGAGRKRVRDSANGLAAMSPASTAAGGHDLMRDDGDGEPYDVDMDTQAALDQAERDGDISAVSNQTTPWQASQVVAPAPGHLNGVPFYPHLGGVDLDDEYDGLSCC